MGAALEEQGSTCSFGQCFSSPVHKSSRGNNITPSVSLGTEIMADGHRKSSSIASSSYCKGSQCSSRSFKQAESQDMLDRMVSEGDGCTEDLESILQSSHRSVCISTESQTSSLLLVAEGPSSIGGGKLVNFMGGDAGICISPGQANAQNARPSVPVQLQNTVTRSEVATQTMVYLDSQLVAQHAVNNSSSSRP